MADLAGMDQVWKNWIAPYAPPVRCCCVVELGEPSMRVEMMVSAATGDVEHIVF